MSGLKGWGESGARPPQVLVTLDSCWDCSKHNEKPLRSLKQELEQPAL